MMIRSLFSAALLRLIGSTVIDARIIPKDDGLTVFPDVCHLERGSDIENTKSNCGIYRLDGMNHTWTLRSKDGVHEGIDAIIPGDILTHLQEGGLISDPFYDNNFLDQREIWMGKRTLFNSSCWSASQKTDQFTDEYEIPNLEKRERTWIYETNFTLRSSKGGTSSLPREDHDSFDTTRILTSADDTRKYAVVVEGIKMGASIFVNNINIGNATDQFLRYIFPLSPSVLHTPLSNLNTLSVVFDPEIDTAGRFMAASGGWDWAPYSKAAEASCSSRRVLTFGIVKPIYIVEVSDVAIIHVVPKIKYLGDASATKLNDRGDFQVLLDVHLQYLGNDIDEVFSRSSVIVLRAEFLDHNIYRNVKKENSRVGITESASTIIVTISWVVPRNRLRLWWPNNLGDANLYTIHLAYINESKSTSTSWITTKIGFRTIELITHEKVGTNDKNAEGTGSAGMYFRINGVGIWARGANVVPMSQLDGRLTDIAHQSLVESAAAANMNMLRVWGGGMLMPESFYRSCDELGILLYHDFFFVNEQFHELERKRVVRDEIRFIVRILSSHVSVVLWNGCNECNIDGSSRDDFTDFVFRIVAREDPFRVIWPSSPSQGWHSGVYASNGLPSGSALTYKSNYSNSVESHGPYNHGWSRSFQSVNGHDRGKGYDMNIPIEVDQSLRIGLNLTNHFISEFGASVHSSFESMSSSMNSEWWSLHGDSRIPSNCSIVYENYNSCEGENVMTQRNYPCDSHIENFFGVSDLSKKGEDAFKEQLYKCMVSQMLWMKGRIENMRNRNIFGSLIWQLNENWPTGGWGLVEYGSETNIRGQVVGGRWKPLMHLLRGVLFQDVMAACGKAGKCFIRNDGLEDFKGNIMIECWSKNGVTILLDREVIVHPTTIEYFNITTQTKLAESDYILSISILNDESLKVMSQNIALMVPPVLLSFLRTDARITIESASIQNRDILLTLKADHTALFINLSTSVEGDFSDNAFSMSCDTKKIVKFALSRYNDLQIDLNSFLTSLRIEHVAMYLPKENDDLGRQIDMG